MIDTLTNPAFFVVYALLQAALFLLLIRFLDLYEREPLSLLVVMAVWGATGAVALSLAGNGILLGSLPPMAREVFGPAISAPLVEEAAKGVALVAAFALSWLAYRRFGFMEMEGVTDGIVYGAAVGLGFAFTEDILYLLNVAGEQNIGAGLGEYTKRVDFFGVGQLGHAVYTGIFGAGLGLATWSRGRIGRVGFPILGLAVAMLMHALHNGAVSIALVARYGMENAAAALGGGILPDELYGQMRATAEAARAASDVLEYVFLGVFLFAVAMWLLFQRRVIRAELAEEARMGLISRDEWERMPRYWRRSKEYWRMLWAGEIEAWRTTRMVHNELVDLAFLKWRKAGRERIGKRRRRIRNLKSMAERETTDVSGDGA